MESYKTLKDTMTPFFATTLATTLATTIRILENDLKVIIANLLLECWVGYYGNHPFW